MNIHVVMFLYSVLPLLLLIPISHGGSEFGQDIIGMDKSKHSKEDPTKCRSCMDLVEGIQKGVKKTEHHNFGGGNTKWEETTVGSYATSETRFLEVTEEACLNKDFDCNNIFEKYEEILEQWWEKEFAKVGHADTLYEYLCIQRARVCCAWGTYGPKCVNCPGGPEKPCGGHGECNGNGTRLSNATGFCECEEGYTGFECDICQDGWYEAPAVLATEFQQCLECDESCGRTCTGEGPLECDFCATGYELIPGKGCVDKNECKLDDHNCDSDFEFCKNTPGSHKCTKCHESCQGGCRGPGSKHCTACNPIGWFLQDDTCRDVDECATAGTCDVDQYCTNSVGSYKCTGCDVSCSGCTGSGAEKCVDCAAGHERTGDSGVCECRDDSCRVALPEEVIGDKKKEEL